MPMDTDLHKAAAKDQYDMVEAMIEEGADVNELGAGDRTALHRAVGAGCVEVCKLLLEKGANVDAQDSAGRTPLHWAALSGEFTCVRLLVEASANVGLKTRSGWTPLHSAAVKNHESTAYLLLESGVEPTVVNEDGFLAWQMAFDAGHKVLGKKLKKITAQHRKGNRPVYTINNTAPARPKIAQIEHEGLSKPVKVGLLTAGCLIVWFGTLAVGFFYRKELF